MGFLGLIYTAVYYVGLEFIAFVLVDVIVKTPLRDAAWVDVVHYNYNYITIFYYYYYYIFILCN